MPQPNEGEDASAKRRQRSCCSWQALPPNEGAEVAKTRTHDINKAAGRNILNTEHGTRIFTGGGLGKLVKLSPTTDAWLPRDCDEIHARQYRYSIYVDVLLAPTMNESMKKKCR